MTLRTLSPYLDSTVIGLLFGGAPLAVAWLVVAVVVDAVYGQPRRTLSHIGEEVSKVSPSIADSDSSTSIEMPLTITLVCATSDHALPRLVSRADLPSDRMPMLVHAVSFSSGIVLTVAGFVAVNQESHR